ncbi:MAG: hypothetical protein R3F56_00710 [Planctomycetota bacterium]
MTGSLLLYLAYQGFALLLCLWAAVSALHDVREHDPLHRIWTLLAALALPLSFGAALYGHLGGPRQLLWAELALPLVAFATTFVNVVTLHSQGLLLKLVHLPVFTFNAALTGIYALRALQDWFGVDLGIFGGSILHGHGLLQTWVGQRDAAANPHWLHLPLLLPLWLRYRLPHELTLLLSGVVAGVLVSLLALRMPVARATVVGFRTASADTDTGERADPLQLGYALRGGAPLERSPFDEWQDQLARLDARSVTIEVTPELVENADALDTLAAGLVPLRRQRELVVVVRPPRRLLGVPARDLGELASGMAKAHWLAAERLQPDVVVAFVGPFGTLTDAVASPATLERWQQTITRAAAEIKQARSTVKVAVAIDHAAPHTRELFQWMTGERSPVDIAGFSVLPHEQSYAETAAEIDTYERWMRAIPPKREVRVLLAGASPHACGGELGQWTLLASILRFAQRSPAITQVCIASLADDRDPTGLLANLGQPRLAFEHLVRFAAGQRALRKSRESGAPPR